MAGERIPDGASDGFDDGADDFTDTEVEGETLRALILSSERRRITIRNGRVLGPLDLSSITVDRPVEFIATTFTGPVVVAGSSLRRFRLIDCTLEQGCNANGAVFAGDLALAGSTIRGALVSTAGASRRAAALWLTDATIDGRLLAAGTSIEATPLPGRPDTRAIHGDRLRVGGSIRLSGGFRASEEVRLIGAEIGGSLDLVSCHLSAADAALDLGSVQVGGDLFLVAGDSEAGPALEGRLDMENLTVAGQTLILAASFQARTPPGGGYHRFEPGDRRVAIRGPGARFRGEVNLAEGCTIDGRLDLRGALFEGRFDLHDTSLIYASGYALDLSNARIGGDLRLARRSRSIRLVNASVDGSLFGRRTTITASDDQPKALSGRGLRVGGELNLDSAIIDGGTVDLRRIRVRGDVNLGGARLSSPIAQSLALSSAHLDGGVYLDQGFRAEGTVRLSRASITGQLHCDGTFVPGESAIGPTPAVEAGLLHATGGMVLHWVVLGAVDLSDATTTVLADRTDGWGPDYRIGGFTYDRFAGADATEPATDTDTSSRIEWLLSQSSLDASSFEQLAGYYRRHGRTVDAERVLIARNRALRALRSEVGGWPNRLRNLVDHAWDLSVGYGYRAGRAGGFLLALVVVTAWLLSLPAATGAMRTTDEDNTTYNPSGPVAEDGSPLDSSADSSADGSDDGSDDCGHGRVRCYDPVFYAVDTVVPLVDLHQRSTWHPDRSAPYGWAYQRGLDAAVLLGWATTSALVLGLTHALGPGRR
jgi:cytoskeletal protein CcmA (bactofilin family)